MPDPAPIITVSLNPAVDQTLSIPGFTAGRVNRVAAISEHAGGKGVNVSSFLADLGAPVIATGFLGRENARLFEDHLARKGIGDAFLRVPGATRVCIKISDQASGQTTDINPPGLLPSMPQLAELEARIGELTMPGRWVVLTGSAPAGVDPAVYARLIRLVHAKGGHVLVDTSGPALREALTAAPEIVKPNIAELEEALERRLATPAAVVAAARSMLAGPLDLVVVSMGADGAAFVTPTQALLARPPRVVVKSSVSAGDAMVAGILYARGHGMVLEDGARLATALGAYAVTRIGSGLERPDAHKAYLEQVVLERVD